MDYRLKTSFIEPLLAGMLIGFGDLIYVVSANHILGAFLFSLGLLSILVKCYPLYTGRVGDLSHWSDIPNLCLMLVMNFIGIALICSAACLTRIDLSAVDQMVQIKTSQSWTSALILSYGCGVMMHLAVNGWRTHQNPLLVIMPVMFFILCSFEHCIADYGYFWMWISEDGFSHFSQRFADLPAGFCWNLPVMIIGNALGSLTFSKVC